MAVVTLRYTVVDGKGKESAIELYTVDFYTIAQIREAAIAMIPLIRDTIKGGLVKGSITIDMGIGDLLSSFPSIAIPSADSDVEEGGLFIFTTVQGDTKRNRFPTFDEDLILDQSRQVDVANPRVAPLVAALTEFVVISGGAEVKFNDSRGDELDRLSEAYEQFSRRKK